MQSYAELQEKILHSLLNLEDHCVYPVKQKALLMYDVLAVVDEVMDHQPLPEVVSRFILAQLMSASSKTRNKTKELIKKYRPA